MHTHIHTPRKTNLKKNKNNNNKKETNKHANTSIRAVIQVLKYRFLVPTTSKLERENNDGHLTIPVKKMIFIM